MKRERERKEWRGGVSWSELASRKIISKMLMEYE